jgi:predicted nucleic acid-binding protein
MIRRVVVDTNIAFSALLNVNSRIGQILVNGNSFYEFYSPEYVREEIFEHKGKIQLIANLDDNKFIKTYELVMHNITILNHSVIPIEFYKKAENLCSSIDIDDTPFVAVTEFIRGKLWTGDKVLINGLIAKDYKRIISTDELHKDFIKKEKIR